MLLVAITLVVCAPGYPGTSAEAQPAMDALARALGGPAHRPVEAVYEETADGGLKRLAAKDAALLLAPLPFFLDQERKLALAARMMAVPKDGTGPLQKWTLVTGKEHPADLRGYPVQSTAGYSPRFVHAMSPPLKGGKVVDSAAILSGLRRAANGAAPPPQAGAAELLARADDAWSRRADLPEAASAEQLYLEAARADPSNAAAYAGAIRAKAFRIGREKDGGRRGPIAAEAVAVGQLCEQHAAPSPLCDY